MEENYKCVIVADGQFPTIPYVLDQLREATFIIACDGAVLQLELHNIHADVVIGDLDSLPKELWNHYENRLVQIRDQETNDLTKAVNYAQMNGYREILILGATGLREDHTLGNISLLMLYAPQFDRIEMLSDFGRFTPIRETTVLSSYIGQQISIFSLYPHNPITVSGLRYPIENRRLLYWWEGTLNEALGEEFKLTLSKDAQVIVYRQING